MKNIKIIAVAAALTLGVSSCNLDRFPKHQLAKEVSLQTVTDAERWASGMRATLRDRVYGGFMHFANCQDDLMNPQKEYGNNQGSIYNWSIRPQDYDTENVWSNYYHALIHVNDFLGRVGQVKAIPSEEPRLARTIGDAHFVRAFYYSELAKRFAPLYSTATAATELCVPLVLTFDVSLRPARATQQAVYTQILKDIAEAKTQYGKTGDATLAAGAPGSPHLTTDAVKALEARVYLQMRNYPEALRVAKELISSGRYPLVAANAKSFTDMWWSDKSTEDILRLFVNKDDTKELPVGVGGYFAAGQVGKSPNVFRVCQPNWLPTQGVIDLYEDKDLRKAVYFDNSEHAFLAGQLFQKGDITVISKFKGNPALASTTTDPLWGIRPDGRHAPRVFRITEAYMIAAEAAYKGNDEAAAKGYLNAVRASRGLDAVDASGDALFTQIKDERTREFAFEGMRLWDLKRWEMPMQRKAPQIVAGKEFLAEEPGNTMTIEANNFRFTWPIPNRDLKANPNLAGQQNKGY